GGAYIAMSSKNLGTDMNYAWPTAQIAVLGSEAAVKIMNRKEIASAKDPEDMKKKLVDNFTEKFANPYVAASYGTIDSVIDPAETRPVLIRALEAFASKREKRIPRKHGNINL
ncbi:MAG: methylmalonyl-CoA carboxyltransferase, partial [Thaumarchaeota archaeon]